MPVPLNATVEITRTWLTKRLGYYVDDSIPVRPSKLSVKATTPMDIDLVCTHPRKNCLPVSIGNIEYTLPKHLLVECKGWFDYSAASHDIILGLSGDLALMGSQKFIPEAASKRKDKLCFTFLKEEVYEKGKELFGADDFVRVIICPDLQPNVKPRNRPVIQREVLLDQAKEKGIFVFQLSSIVKDLVDFCREIENKDYLRKDFVLELFHLLEVVGQLHRIS